MKNYLLRNRHTLLAGVVAAFAILTLLEAGLSGRELFSIELDNSFLRLRIDEAILREDVEILDDFDIDF